MTFARIDLKAIAANLRGVRSLAGKRTILVAVKANAYGHGAVPVARYIESHSLADYLGVATVAEGHELRTAGIELPILKLSHCLGDELSGALAARLTLTVVDAETISAAQAAGAGAKREVPVHLKLDSGMRRIGSELDSAIELANQIDASPNLSLEGIFTHLPVSDTAAGREFTTDQLRRFNETVSAVQEARGPIRFVHAANSGGVLGHELGDTTMVRPGIMVYGYYPDATTPRPVALRQAFSLVSRVSFVKDVPAGESVGYGRTWASPSAIKLATVPVGYGDGYSRLLSNRGRVLIHGRSYPIRGRVCMDQLMVEVDDSVAVGDEVVLLGTQSGAAISTEEVAELMGTITYEVTCLVTSRVPRQYLT